MESFGFVCLSKPISDLKILVLFVGVLLDGEEDTTGERGERM
jgi:hypothetical protein